MPKRFECEDAPGTWVEFSDAWTRRELRDALSLTGDEFAALLQRKVTACHLATVDGGAIETPAAITNAALDDQLDYAIYCWLIARLGTYVVEVQRLGEATQRRLWRAVAGETAAATTTEMTA